MQIRRLRTVSTAILVFIILLTITLSFLAFKSIKSRALNDVRNNLQLVVATTADTLKLWRDDNFIHLKIHGRNSDFVEAADTLASLEPDELKDSNALRDIRQYMLEHASSSLWKDFFIIDRERISIASFDDAHVGRENILNRAHPDLLSRAFLGESQLILNVPGDGPFGFYAYFVIPVRTREGAIPAVLAYRELMEKNFSRICRAGRIGARGITYAFDREGRLIRDDRFRDRLIEAGLISPDQTEIAGIEIRDPGRDLTRGELSGPVGESPYTYPVEQALKKISGISNSSYRDYRGIPVFGAWVWSDAQGYGLVSEIEERDALSSYILTRNIYAAILAFLLLLITISAVFSMALVEKALGSLQKSNQSLEESLENSIEALTHPFYIIDADNYNILLANKAAKSIGGGALSTCYALSHHRESPCVGTEHPCPMEKIRKSGKPFSAEHIHYNECGEPLIVEVHGYPIFNREGELTRVIEYSHDITERKKAEESLKLLNQLVYGSLEAANVGAWWLDFKKDDTFIALDTTARIMGLSGNLSEDKEYRISDWESILRNTADHYPLYKRDVDQALDKLHGTISGEYDSYKAVFPVLKEDSRELRWIEARSEVVARTPSGRAELMTGTLIDVTEQHESEVMLEKAKEAAEEAAKIKSDFMANISHEIRTPMNAIIGLSHLIRKTDLDARQEDYMEKISSSAHHLLGLINDVLDFSRTETGRLSLKSVNFDLYELFDNLGGIISLKAEEKNLSLTCHLEPDVPGKLIGDPLRLVQVLQNLAENALKFTDEGEVAISGQLNEIKDSKALIQFKVADTGIGMTDEQQRNLFQAFSQGDSSTTRKYGGIGLGLSISRKLVQMMGGSISVESRLAVGSEFSFSVPFEVREESSPMVIPQELQDREVLIIDDNDASRNLFAEYMKAFSLKPVPAGSGSEALRLIRSRLEEDAPLFSLILVDYSMPRMDGFQTVEEIDRIIGGNKRPGFILITGYGREDVLMGVDKYDFDGFILKPVNQSLLFNTILEVLRTANGRTAISVDPVYPEGFERIRGGRILLVEDNPINQQVAGELLESEGFSVDIAVNGLESLQMTSGNDYDIVLMDLQMPVMGGIQATKEIRKKLTGDQLPIVAMTADVLGDAKERAIEAGMNGYLTKPIEPGKLWLALARWIDPSGVPPQDSSFVSSIKKPLGDIPRIEGIDTAAGLLRVGGNRSLYKKLLKQFADDYSHSVSDILVYLQDGRREEAVRAAHTLKGVSGNLGATELQKELSDLETMIGKGYDAGNHLKAVEQAIGRLVMNIDRSGIAFESQSLDRALKTIPEDDILNMLKEAGQSLAERRPKPAQTILSELQNSRLEPPVNEKITICRNLLSKYKMKEARSVIAELVGSMEGKRIL